MTGISYVDYYLPDNKITTEEYLEKYVPQVDKSDFIASSGIRFIHYEKQINYIQVLEKLVENYLNQKGTAVEEFSHIIYTNLSNYKQNDVNIPYYIHKRFGFVNASVIFLNNACATCLQAIQVGSALLEQETGKKILILSVTSGLSDTEKFMDITIAGDAVGIMVLSDDSSEIQMKVIDSLSLADGSYSYNHYLQNKREPDRLGLITTGVNAINQLVTRNILRKEDISYYVPQSINKSLYSVFAKYLRVEPEHFFVENIERGGHLENVDTIRNYSDVLQKADKNAFIILWGMGLLNYDSMYNTILLQKII